MVARPISLLFNPYARSVIKRLSLTFAEAQCTPL
jgi:hypothetical protein